MLDLILRLYTGDKYSQDWSGTLSSILNILRPNKRGPYCLCMKRHSSIDKFSHQRNDIKWVCVQYDYRIRHDNEAAHCLKCHINHQTVYILASNHPCIFSKTKLTLKGKDEIKESALKQLMVIPKADITFRFKKWKGWWSFQEGVTLKRIMVLLLHLD